MSWPFRRPPWPPFSLSSLGDPESSLPIPTRHLLSIFTRTPAAPGETGLRDVLKKPGQTAGARRAPLPHQTGIQRIPVTYVEWNAASRAASSQHTRRPPSTPSAGDANVVHTGHNHSVLAQTRMPSPQAQEREPMTVDAFRDSSDHADIRLLPHCSPASSRCQDFITSFVNRARLRGQAPGNKAFPSALEYFNLIEAELRKANMDPERVDATRGTMMSLWQERLVALVGATVTTPERLERLVEVMSKGAEELGGVPGVRFVARWFACGRGGETDLLDGSQDSLDAGDGADDQPRTVASETEDPAMDLSDGRLRQGGDPVGDAAPHEQGHDALGHDRPQQQDPIVSPKHIKEAPDFFTYHARKARRKHREAGDEPRDSVVSASFKDWRSLPEATQKVWVELSCRWQMGEQSLLKHKNVAHLFDGGRAREPPGRPPVDEGYASGSLPQSSAGRQADDGARETGVVRSQRPPFNARPQPEIHPQPVARPQSTPRPHKQLLREIADPHRTIFLRVPGVTNAQTVAMACRVAAGGLDSSTAYTDAYTIGQGNFVTFREVLAARRVATGHVNVACPQKNRPGNVVWSSPLLYPPTEPRVFVTRVPTDHPPPTAVAAPDIFVALAAAFPDARMRLARQTGATSKLFAWLVFFAAPVGCLRFSAHVRQANGNARFVWFDPVSGADRCPICTFGHDVRDCDLMESLSAKQVKAGERKGQYLKKLPAAAS